jgi:hypothetical protein
MASRSWAVYGGSMRGRMPPMMCGTTTFGVALDDFETEG